MCVNVVSVSCGGVFFSVRGGSGVSVSGTSLNYVGGGC